MPQNPPDVDQLLASIIEDPKSGQKLRQLFGTGSDPSPVLQEAKNSSAVENIIITHDELFQASLFSEKVLSWETKEVLIYADALRKGHAFVKNNACLSTNAIVEIQRVLEDNDAGFQRLVPLFDLFLAQSQGIDVYKK